MRDLIDEKEDYFYDSCDFIQCTPSPSSEYVSTTSEGLKFYETEYERWGTELLSVEERRRIFLSEMGFYDQESDLLVERMSPTSDHASSVCSTSDTDDILDSIIINSISVNNDSYEHERMLFAFSRDVKVPLEDIRLKRWRSFLGKFKNNKLSSERKNTSAKVSSVQLTKPKQINAKCSNKSCKELTGLYMLQNIQAHGSPIKTMKFSPDGKYLASGCEDGTIRIWGVTEIESMHDAQQSNIYSEIEKDVIINVLKSRKKGFKCGSLAMPKKIFGIYETPVQEFKEHSACILDLCWSKSNYLLSSSEDKTVRLWQMNASKCLKVFYHSNYVTCIQFNPADERYFLSGSIDGRVRIWSVSDNRVYDWLEVSDIVTAACYQPDGQGIIVGTIEGNCQFYSASGNNLELKANFKLRGKINCRTNRITAIQLSSKDPQRIMVTFADSRVTVLDELDNLNAHRPWRHFSNYKKSASFPSSGKYVISVDDDSRVHLRSCEEPLEILTSKKQTKCLKSCEQFLSEGVSVAVPWLGMEGSSSERAQIQLPENFSSEPHNIGCFDRRLKHSATWPEEKLSSFVDIDGENNRQNLVSSAPAWSLVIVTGGCDGQIRCYQNFGLPSQ